MKQLLIISIIGLTFCFGMIVGIEYAYNNQQIEIVDISSLSNIKNINDVDISNLTTIKNINE